MALQVLDEAGRSIPAYQHTAATAGAWWNRYSDRTIGTVKVLVDSGPLFRGVIGLLLSLAAGGGLALLVYSLPLKVIRRIKGQIRVLQRRATAQLTRVPVEDTADEVNA